MQRAEQPGRWLVPVLILATFLTTLQAMALDPLLPEISDDLGTDVSLLGQIPAVTMFLAALSSLRPSPPRARCLGAARASGVRDRRIARHGRPAADALAAEGFDGVQVWLDPSTPEGVEELAKALEILGRGG